MWNICSTHQSTHLQMMFKKNGMSLAPSASFALVYICNIGVSWQNQNETRKWSTHGRSHRGLLLSDSKVFKSFRPSKPSIWPILLEFCTEPLHSLNPNGMQRKCTGKPFMSNLFRFHSLETFGSSPKVQVRPCPPTPVASPVATRPASRCSWDGQEFPLRWLTCWNMLKLGARHLECWNPVRCRGASQKRTRWESGIQAA